MTPRLKSLELHGYKTFASKVLFDFPGDVTAVVGPNGSGKSNIADALRWVLGEQAFSLLRGRKTEDMIFTGSELRPRASMASASIIFNNDDGWLPIDFSEVSITRRAYRDGDNEYLINGQRVRLKEINELLSQTGLSERTYTVIGQGLVDAALSLKPEERRKFFEEAAGIGLYRSRREESINRLETTRRNLERVNDILAEIKPRLSSLEKQAKKAQEFERVQADLRISLRDWYGYQWHKTQDDFNNAHEALKMQETLHKEHARLQAEVDRKYETNRSQIQSLRRDLDQWHKDLSGLHEKWELAIRELAVLDERAHGLRENRNSLQNDLVKIQSEEKALALTRQEMETRKTDLSRQFQEAKQNEDEARKLYDEKNALRSKTESDLQKTREDKLEMETRIIQNQANLEQLAQRQKQILDGIRNQTLALEKLEKEITAKKEEVEQSRDAAKLVISEFQADDLKKIELDRDLEKLSREQKKLLDKQSEADAQKAKLEAQLKVLASAEAQLIGTSEGARFLMNSIKEGRLSSAADLIHQQLLVDPEYEKAIAAALGEGMDGIYLYNAKDQEHVLSFLEQNDSNRVTLFIAGKLEKHPNPATLSEPGVLGIASKLVKVKEEFAELVEAILGRTLVVDNRHTAHKIRSMVASDIKIVTQIGEVFMGAGWIIAGKENRSGIIGRPREKKDIELRLGTCISELKELETGLVEAREKISKFDVQRNEIIQRMFVSQKESDRLQSVVQQLDLAIKQSEVERAWHLEQKKGFETQKGEIQISQKDAQGIITTGQAGIKAIDEKKAELERSLQGMNLDEFQQQTMVWNSRVAVLTNSIKEIEQRLDENQKSTDTNGINLRQVEMNLDKLQETAKQVEQDQNAYHASEVSIKSDLDILQQKINPAEMDLARHEELNKGLQKEQDAARNATSNAERFYTQAQIEMNRQKEKIEVLRERIQEDFGLVAFEYSKNMIGPNPLPFEGLVEQLPRLREVPLGLEDTINLQRTQLRRMGPINQEAEREYTELQERFVFLSTQTEDLDKAEINLRQIIAELDVLMKTEFRKTFDAVEKEFHQIFSQLFAGGSARLFMTEEENISETGVDIQAKLPGRREQGLSLLSGGERSLTAAALIFALLRVSPTPFCVLDEVDAMLDEANVGRFCELLTELSKNTQFIIITHNRNTVQTADVIYGVTMGKDSASQVISLKMDELTEDMVK